MEFFNWIFGASSKPVEDQENTSVKPEVDEKVFVDYSDPVEENHDNQNVYNVAYGTGKAIDVIYAFINRSFEQKGYDDAIVNDELSYCETGKTLIMNELKQLFEQVVLKYKAELRTLDVQIGILKERGMTNHAVRFISEKEMLEEHMDKIQDMKKRLEEGDVQLLNMVMTYERGFLKGIAAKSDSILNK